MPPTTDTERPVRYCHGCRAYDDHPRVIHSVDVDRPDLDHLYHYDCAPAAVVADPVLAPILTSGKRGDELAEHATAYAATIPEAPADEKDAR